MNPLLDRLERALREAVPGAACRREEPGAHGPLFEATVATREVVAAVAVVDREGYAFDTITGVDWLAQGEFEVVYDFFHFTAPVHVVLRVRVPREAPEVPSVASLFPGADWPEREAHEFFGIRFTGHANLTPLLLPEDATYHPLRKDFAGAA